MNPEPVPTIVDARRRDALILLGASGLSLLTGRAGAQSGTNAANDKAPQCVVSPQQIEGPYFSDGQLQRSDIRSEPSTGIVTPGVPLVLTLRISAITSGVSQAVSPGRCSPLANALVDIWHCDAQGVYSDVSGGGTNTRGKFFLRGYQMTDKAGLVHFNTIYPGWYSGRTVHIHLKIRTSPVVGPEVEFTSQLYFDDALSDRIYAQKIYAGRSGRGDRNDSDWVYRRGGGKQMQLSLNEAGQGFAAFHDVGVPMV